MLVLSTDRIGYIDGLSCKRWIVEPCLDRSSILLTSTKVNNVLDERIFDIQALETRLFFIGNEKAAMRPVSHPAIAAFSVFISLYFFVASLTLSLTA